MAMDDKQLSRRTFLTYLGYSAVTLAAASTGLGTLAEKAEAAAESKLFSKTSSPIAGSFIPVPSEEHEDLTLPKGYKYDMIAQPGDRINPKGETFGHQLGYTHYFPIEANVRGLLWINHPTVPAEQLRTWRNNGTAISSKVQQLLNNQGGSIVEVFRNPQGSWKIEPESSYARRVTGTDRVQLTGPARSSKALAQAAQVQGIVAADAGCPTLWGTMLVCENRTEEMAAMAGLPLTHYGWIAEVDPLDGSNPLRKHTSLGRFHHGNAAMSLTKDGRVVVYMGDAAPNSCVYKYISKEKYDSAKGKANTDLLTNGTLYAANFEEGTWIELTIEAVKSVLDNLQLRLPESITQLREGLVSKLQQQADIFVYAREAALLLGATPTDHPEYIQLHPTDGSVLIAHTNNLSHGNLHGQINRIWEQNNDKGANTFDFEIYAVGGHQSAFSSPSGLTIDSRQNLWITSNVPADRKDKRAYTSFKNNGLLLLRASKEPMSVKAERFASAPKGTSLIGPCLVPDEGTMFVSVQTQSEETGKSWPAVVAITGFVG